MLYRLIVLTGPLKNQRITVAEEPMTVGRAPDCQIVLPDDEVATRHAELSQKPEVGLHIRDLGTMNRVIVNGREMRESRLKHGDMVEIGHTRFLVQAVVQAEVSGSDADPDERHSNPRVLIAAAVVVVLAVITWIRWPQLHGRKAAGGTPDVATNLVVSPPPVTSMVVEATTTNAPPVVVPVSPVVVAPSTQTTAEIQQMREDLRALSQTVREIVQPTVITNVMPVVVVTAEPPPVVVAPAPAVVVPPPDRPEQEDMLQRARELIAKGDAAGADAGLEALEKKYPDFLPAYEERARLAEAAGDLEKANAQWQQVLKRTTDSPLYQRALAERARLVKSAAPTPPPEVVVQPSPKLVPVPEVPKPAVTTTVPALPVGRVMRVLNVEQMRFPAGDDFDDMRTLNIVLSQTDPTTEVVNEDVTVSVTFFDEDQATNTVFPSRIVKPAENLRPSGGWGADRRSVVSATYVLPKGVREKERAAGHDERYYGYVVRVEYRGHKQDEWAAPRGLLKLPVADKAPPAAPEGSQISATGNAKTSL